MLSLYPNQSYPLEVLCSHYLRTGKILLSCSLNLYVCLMFDLQIFKM